MANSHEIVTHPFTITLIRIKAAQLCRRSDFSRSDRDDLQQEMELYLLRKAHLFDSERGNIEAFVTTSINSWVGMTLRFRARDKRRPGLHAFSLEGTEIDNDGEADTLAAVLSAADLARRTQHDRLTPSELIDLRDCLHSVLAALSPSERALVALVADRGVAGAARARKVSRRQIENAMARIRARFDDEGLAAL